MPIKVKISSGIQVLMASRCTEPKGGPVSRPESRITGGRASAPRTQDHQEGPSTPETCGSLWSWHYEGMHFLCTFSY